MEEVFWHKSAERGMLAQILLLVMVSKTSNKNDVEAGTNEKSIKHC